MIKCKVTILALLFLFSCSMNREESKKLLYRDFKNLFKQIGVQINQTPNLIVVTPSKIGCHSCIKKSIDFLSEHSNNPSIIGILIGEPVNNKVEITIVYHKHGRQIAEVVKVDKIDAQFAIVQPKYYFLEENKITKELKMLPNNYSLVLSSAKNHIKAKTPAMP